MRNLRFTFSVLAILLLATLSALPQAKSASPADRTSLVIVFNDGRQQSFDPADTFRIEFKGSSMIVAQGDRRQTIPMSEIARIEFNRGPASASVAGRGRFVGKWSVGEGNGGRFYITLDRNGEATKTIGANHGTWIVVDGEARITWDDGWHDAIRKAGNKFEKVAFAPGKTFSDPPANVTEAENTTQEPI